MVRAARQWLVVGLLLATLGLTLWQAWGRERNQGRRELAAARIGWRDQANCRPDGQLDPWLLSTCPSGNVLLRFLWDEAHDEVHARMSYLCGSLWLRAVFALHPRRVFVGEGPGYRGGFEGQPVNQPLPSRAWLDTHGVTCVVEMTWGPGGPQRGRVPLPPPSWVAP